MEETGQTVQETQKVQAEQTGENGKNVGMPECETMELIMESRSENEEFARVVEQAMEPMFTTCPEDGRSGMGFSFMEAFMDRVEVVSAPGKGTSVTMKKKIGR